jgi:hypothetical protein
MNIQLRKWGLQVYLLFFYPHINPQYDFMTGQTQFSGLERWTSPYLILMFFRAHLMNNRPELWDLWVILVLPPNRLVAIFLNKNMLATLSLFLIICHSLIVCGFVFLSYTCRFWIHFLWTTFVEYNQTLIELLNSQMFNHKGKKRNYYSYRHHHPMWWLMTKM